MEIDTNISPLSALSIQIDLGACSLGRTIHIHDEVSSTNATALALIDSDINHGTVILAEGQTAGRGRLGRPWFSPPKKNLYCSIILKEVCPQNCVSWIPLITGLAITQAVEDLTNLRPSLKWPNDILVGDRKLGGVLCESAQQRSKRWAIVVGFGLNINSRIGEFPENLQAFSTTLTTETGKFFDRNRLTARILSNLEAYYTRLQAQNIQEVRASYLDSCSTIGRHIYVHLVNGEEIKGIALDVGCDGSLQVAQSLESSYAKNLGKNIMEIRSGEVTHIR